MRITDSYLEKTKNLDVGDSLCDGRGNYIGTIIHAEISRFGGRFEILYGGRTEVFTEEHGHLHKLVAEVDGISWSPCYGD